MNECVHWASFAEIRHRIATTAMGSEDGGVRIKRMALWAIAEFDLRWYSVVDMIWSLFEICKSLADKHVGSAFLHV